ncbi:uncharacterized protein LOC128920265 isoform X1 [Zeugodacus cucurbitae]|uniref:uncharacterized protein LOC128920265 isoform X1 n=1 Tax=Zeugodacus cucurbitae TaxID=28588 RepID=UPI0023D9027C|nr:uncharacterized protein LOC128920265 isoform X1 [Zeugodacus cucurbitae]XP_054083201.1 uncharacterized protein LOC128920265 isoform X1 [Zeugodacus cucurbitae]
MIDTLAFNYRKQLFAYDPSHVKGLSNPLTKAQIKTNNIKMNAYEMKLFLNTILLMNGDLIDEFDSVYKFLITFIKIVDIVMYEEFSDDILNELRALIVDHHTFYTTGFKEKLKPKHHFMVHYVNCIKELGPLKFLWCFRFEGKHAEFKKYANNITSRKNIPLTLATKYCFQFCSYLFGNSFFQNDLVDCKNFSPIDLSKLEFYQNLCTKFTIGNEVLSMRYKGVLYEKNYYVKSKNTVLLILKIFFDLHNEIFLICQECKTSFSEKFQSHEVLGTNNAYYLKKIDLKSVPSKLYTLNDGKKVVRFF